MLRLFALHLAVVCASAGGRAQAAPQFTPETVVDALKPAAALGDQWNASVAYGGGHYFAVWQDGNVASDMPPSVIRGARFDWNGTLIDDVPSSRF